MAETRVKKEVTASEAPTAKFRSAGERWIEDNSRALSLVDSRSQDSSHETYDF